MEYTLTHQKTEQSQIWGRPIRSPKQIPPRQKRSSTSDTPQNQLAQCPKSASCSEEKLAWVHTGGLTRSWSSSACPDACLRSTKEKRTLAASAQQGRNRGDPPKQMFLAAARSVPPNPLLRASEPRAAGSWQPSWRAVMATAARLRLVGGNPGSQMSRERSPAVGAKYCDHKCGLAAHCAEANKETRLMRRKVRFISEASNLAGKLPSEGQLPSLAIGARVYLDGGRRYAQKQRRRLSQSSWNWSLVVWPAPSCFKYNLVFSSSSVPGSVCSPFSEAGARNCGSLRHGYSPVIMELTPSAWWAFRYLQDSSKNGVPWGGAKGPWLCLMSKLLLFCLVGLFSFVSAFSHWNLIKLILWLKFFHGRKAGWGPGGGGGWRTDHRVLLCFNINLNIN